jgi:ubiquinone/menaquinone biosynthesis C-methylase UbiE
MVMEQYVSLAGIYDNNINMDYPKWASFVKEVFKGEGLDIRNSKALELGCGSGNMTVQLKKMGFDVIGLDISQEMLQVAAEKALSSYMKIMFINQDMTSFQVNKSFNGVFSFCDVINYITDEEKLFECFKRVYSSLDVGGLFIFDISSEHKLKDVIGNNTFTRNEEDLCYIWDNYLEDSLLEMYITFFVKQGALYKRFDEKHLQRAYGTDRIMSLLNKSGFQNIKTFDDYSFSPINKDTLRISFVAKKEE